MSPSLLDTLRREQGVTKTAQGNPIEPLDHHGVSRSPKDKPARVHGREERDVAAGVACRGNPSW